MAIRVLFNSLPFIWFLPVVYFVFWWLRSRQARYIWLMLSGYVFYGYWDARFTLLMAFSTPSATQRGWGSCGARCPHASSVSSAHHRRPRDPDVLQVHGLSFHSTKGLARLIGSDLALPSWTSCCQSASPSTRSTPSPTSSTPIAGDHADPQPVRVLRVRLAVLPAGRGSDRPIPPDRGRIWRTSRRPPGRAGLRAACRSSSSA